MRGVTSSVAVYVREWERFQLTRLMRGVTSDSMDDATNKSISTHTPHARRDFPADLLRLSR